MTFPIYVVTCMYDAYGEHWQMAPRVFATEAEAAAFLATTESDLSCEIYRVDGFGYYPTLV